MFWRDLHAVTGIWISALALFLLITALPWTTVAGDAIVRNCAAGSRVSPSTGPWAVRTARRASPHAAAEPAVATPLTVDQVIARVAPYDARPPVRLYLPGPYAALARALGKRQNRPKGAEFVLDRLPGR